MTNRIKSSETTEVAEVIRARLNDGRTISDNHVRDLLKDYDRLKADLMDCRHD